MAKDKSLTEKEADKPDMQASDIRDFILECRDEADLAKADRMDKNKENYDMFHLRHDFSHKKEGQSQEILSKQAMTVERTKATFQQALANLSDFWKLELCYPEFEQSMAIRPHEIEKMTNYQLERANYFNHVGNEVESALLASLAITKVTGKLCPKPKYVSKKKGRGPSLKRWIEKIDNKTWELNLSLVRADNYYPDPKGTGLYEIEDSWIDYHELVKMMDQDSDFDRDLLDSVSRSSGVDETEEEFNRARENGQNTPSDAGNRKRIKLTEFWGTVLDRDGGIAYENVQAILANDLHLILPPRPNPLWHQGSPYSASPLLEVANSVWHKALMDAPTQHNRAMIELYNLMVDAAMDQVHGVKQIRKDWLDNPAQVADGISPGTALSTNSMCPPGGKVLEPLLTTVVPPEAINIYQIQNQEFFASSLDSEVRAGIQTDQSATATVEQSNAINSVAAGISKNFENRQSTKVLELSWMTTAQNWDQIDREVFISLFGPQRGEELYSLSSEDVFASTVAGIRFKVFGITQMLAKANDFRKLTTLLQTIASAPPLLEEYVKKYDLGKTLGEIMTALNIDKYKLEIPHAVQQTMLPAAGPAEPQPDQMSQVSEAAGLPEQSGGQFDSQSFPGSPALIGGDNRMGPQ